MQKFLRIASSPYSAQILSLGGSAALTFFSALFLLPSERGLVAVFLVLVSVGGYVACLGVQSEILQSTARGDAVGATQIIRQHVPLQLLLAAVAAALLILTKPFQGMSDDLAYCSAAGIFIGSLFNNFSWQQYGSGRFFWSTAVRGLIPLITLGLSYAMYIFASVSAFFMASLYVGLHLAAVAFMLPQLYRLKGTSNIRMIEVYRNASAYFFCQTETLLLSRSPVLASGIWLPPHVTAVVSISLSLAELQSSLPQMRSAISFKEASTSKRPRLTGHQIRATLRALLPGTALVLVLSFVARQWLDKAYDDLPIFVGLLTLGVASLAVAASAINIMTARRRLVPVIVAQLVMVVMALVSLYLFRFDKVLIALALWSMSIFAGCMVLIFFANMRRPGRHL